MKAYKLEILIIDLDKVGKDEIVSILENTKYPNWCISPDVKSIEEADIGDFWGWLVVVGHVVFLGLWLKI